MIRELTKSDNYKEFSALLNHLSPTSLDKTEFMLVWDQRKLRDCVTFIYLVGTEAEWPNPAEVIAGTVSLVFEPKFSHGPKRYVAHLEDLVVLPEYRGKGIAEALVQKCISYSRDISYKLILDAADNLHQYYTDKGFKKVGGYYRMDLE